VLSENRADCEVTDVANKYELPSISLPEHRAAQIRSAPSRCCCIMIGCGKWDGKKSKKVNVCIWGDVLLLCFSDLEANGIFGMTYV
jgi:hypothetical protein